MVVKWLKPWIVAKEVKAQALIWTSYDCDLHE
jgi:hypothetical protein